MRVEVLYFDGCPHQQALLARLRALLADAGAPPTIELRRITDGQAAQRERFLGSPSVRIDGFDVEPGGERRTDYGLKCRLYRTPAGLSGEPPDEWLRAALNVGLRLRAPGERARPPAAETVVER